MSLTALTISQARAMLDRRHISAVELTRAVLDRISALELSIRAFLTVTADQALADARRADAAMAQGRTAPLTGIPIALKDVICTQGIRTTCGSRILNDFMPSYDAFVARRLKAQQAVMVGKLNMDEFAMGSTTEHSAFQATRNPWNLEHVPGGSSGGSAAAAAAQMCLAALGSDTGGSIRQPASHCGVVGLKPTYGRVSRFGLVAFASSLDQIGPLGRSVSDCAWLLQAVAGHDPADATSAPVAVPDYRAALSQGIQGVRIGIPRGCFDSPGLDAEVAQAVRRGIAALEGLGGRLVDIDLPHARYGVAAYYVIAPSEASSNLARYDGVKYGLRDSSAAELLSMYRSTRRRGFGPEVQRRILLGTYALSAGYYDAYYRKASQVRTLIMRDFAAAFERCDLIASPVTPTPAPRVGAHGDDPLAMYLSDVYTLPANLAGIPGIAVPCGFSGAGLPIGLQLMAGHFQEERLLAAAHAFEQATEFHKRQPPLEP